MGDTKRNVHKGLAGPGILVWLMTAVLAVLKIAGLTQIGWLVVFGPVLGWWALISAFVLVGLVIMGIGALVAAKTKD